MQYAKETTVSVEKTRAKIENTVSRYGASGFIGGWQGNRAMVAFEMRERRLKFLLPLPDKADRQFLYTPVQGNRRSDGDAHKAWEQACRQKWRALALAIKAKLEAVESGISEFDSEFLANIVMPDGCTLGERIVPQLPSIMETGHLPPLLPGPVA